MNTESPSFELKNPFFWLKWDLIRYKKSLKNNNSNNKKTKQMDFRYTLSQFFNFVMGVRISGDLAGM